MRHERAKRDARARPIRAIPTIWTAVVLGTLVVGTWGLGTSTPPSRAAIPSTFPPLDAISRVEYSLSQEFRHYSKTEVETTTGTATYQSFVTEVLGEQFIVLSYRADLPVWTIKCTEPETTTFIYNETVDQDRLVRSFADFSPKLKLGYQPGQFHTELWVDPDVGAEPVQSRRHEFVAFLLNVPVDQQFEHVGNASLLLGGRSVQVVEFRGKQEAFAGRYL
ncbi:MAG: hypothetical protein Kow0069_01170 [Promethearchaeota archaeon]